MPRLLWAAKESSEPGDKCAWIVESLAAERTTYSRAVKVLDVDKWYRQQTGASPAADYTEMLRRVHASPYVESVRNAWNQGTKDDFSLFGRSCGYARAIVYAAVEVCSASASGTSGQIVGSLGGGMHHASASASRGEAAFNGIALAARTLSDKGVPVVILDLDGSCGGGTASLIAENPRVQQIDVAVNDTDAYENTANATLTIVSKAGDYLDVLRDTLETLAARISPGTACLCSVGVDGFERAAAGLAGMTAEMLGQRDRAVFEWCCRLGVRTAYTIGGGGATEAMPKDVVVALHRQTIETAVAVMREVSRK